MMDLLHFAALRHGLVALLMAGCFVVTATRTRVEADAQSSGTKPFEAVISSPDIVDANRLPLGWARDSTRSSSFSTSDSRRPHMKARPKRLLRTPSISTTGSKWHAIRSWPTNIRNGWHLSACMTTGENASPTYAALEDGEVAKAWPWTPIAYRAAFDAHLSRIKRLLERVPAEYRGLLLNDLQGGPSSCGCGNLQCRWAIDYGVPATTEKLPGVDVAARFVAEVGKLAPNKTIVPVWTTECEVHDMAPGKRAEAEFSTGYCGDVDCFDNCRDRFAEQWAALHATHPGPTGILVLHKEFQRDRTEYGAAARWITRAVDYLDQQKIERIPHQQIVVGRASLRHVCC